MVKRLLISILILSMLGFTVAKVSALWSQQNTPHPAPAFDAWSETFSQADWLAGLDPQQKALYERLDQRLQRNARDYEASLLKGLLLFQSGQLAAAITDLQVLTEKAPKFQLAHLILGDLLLARFDQVASIGSNSLLKQVDSKQEVRIEQLREEAQARLQGYLALVGEVEVPRALLSLSADTEFALVVDKSRSRLYVYRNHGPGLPPELVDDFYTVLGKKSGDKYHEGDLRTPNGVYFVTSYLPGDKLPPLYGSGAYPVNYPNEFDRHRHKTGDGIWLHGTRKSLYSRPPFDSEGCVVLTNEELSRVGQYVEVGRTPVVISEQVEWISSSAWLEQNIEIQATLENWRQSWEHSDIDTYLQMYSKDFWAKGYDRNSWAAYKKQVFAGKKYQKIDLEDVSLLAYPKIADARPMIVANFVQRYRSNNFNGDMHKRLYMVQEQGHWKVLYEGRQ